MVSILDCESESPSSKPAWTLKYYRSFSLQKLQIEGWQPVSCFKHCKQAQEIAGKKMNTQKKTDFENTNISESTNNLRSILQLEKT